MRGGLVGTMALALVLAACGGSGISEEEHNLALAELALAQQDLADARRQLADASETGESQGARAAELEARIDEIIRDNNIVLGAQQDPLDELGRMVADFHEREEALMLELEALAEMAERSEAGAVETGAAPLLLAPYAELASLIFGWLTAPETPDWQTVSVAMNQLEEAGDPDLFATWDELAGQYDEVSEDERRTWLANVAMLALQRISENSG